ncbi:MAG TPA: AsmA family protein [Azospirillaceae bacterium]|nr:AsmA family protein [Azospirillaceae bacterium]
MRRLLTVVAAVFVVLILIGAALVLLAGSTLVTDRLVAAIEARIGRDVQAERIDLSVFPAVAATITGLTVADLPGQPEPMLRAGRLDARLPLLPLLSGTVDVDRLVAEDVTLNLRVDRQGRPNWVFRPADGTPGQGDGDPGGGGGGAELPNLVLDELRLDRVAATYEDQRTGRRIVVTGGRLAGAMPALDQPARLEGGARVNDRPVVINASIGSLRDLAEARPTAVKALVDAPDAARLSIDVSPAGDNAAGDMVLLVPDVAEVYRWLDLGADAQPPARRPPARMVRLDGRIAIGGGRAAFEPFTLAVDDARVTGAMAYARTGERPKLTGDVRVSALDLDRLLGARQAQDRPVPPPAARQPPSAQPPAARPPAEGRPVDRDRGPAPSDALPWPSLRQVDAEVALALDGVRFGGQQVGPARASVKLADGVLDAALAEARAFGGTVSGTAKADAARARAELDLDLAGLGLGPLVGTVSQARAGELKVAGRVRASGEGTTRGAFANSLTGAAGLTLTGRDLRLPAPQVPPLQAFDLRLDAPAFDQPARLAGTVTANGETVNLAAQAAAPRRLAGGEPSPVALTVDGRLVQAGFEGDAATSGRLSGRVRFATPSVSDLASRLGFRLEDPPVDALRAEGRVAVAPGALAVEDLVLAPDVGRLTGRVSADWSGPVTRVDARLVADGIVVGDAPTAVPAGGPQGGGQVPAPAADAGWSAEPIDFAALRRFAVDAVLENRSSRIGGVDVGPSTLTLAVADGVLRLDAPDVPVFGGRTTMHAEADGSKDGPGTVHLRAQAEGVEAESLLQALAGIDLVRGTTAVDLDVAAQGRSQRELAAALDGRTRMDLRNGVLRGVNIAAILRDPLAAAAGRADQGARETDFAELAATFAINDGLARTDDLRMLAPLFRVEGEGTVSLPQRQLDLRLVPTVAPTLEGQGARFDLSGVRIPVHVRGPFAKPRVEPDFSGMAAGIARDPAAAGEAVRRLQQGEQPVDVLRGILGGGGGGGGGTSPPPGSQPRPSQDPAEAVGRGLRQLFGR